MAYFMDFKQDYTGLTDAEVENRMDMYGSNVLDKEMQKPVHFSPVKTLLSPSFLLMLIAGVLSFFTDYFGAGIAIILIAVFYIIAEIYVCLGADERMEELTESTSVKFRAIRNGRIEFINKEDIVPEDTIIVQAGEQVPADAYILESRQVTVDEGVFTHSYKPVPKYTGALGKDKLKQTHLYSGSKMLTGVAVCKVTGTGEDTVYFRENIHTLAGARKYYTKLEENMRHAIPACSAIALVVTLISLILWLIYKEPVVDAALKGISVGLCLLPTGVSTVIRIYYSSGISDLINRGTLIKSLADLEKLNSMSVLCVEKEGTISQTRFEVKAISTQSEELLYKAAVLACNPDEPANAIEEAIMVRATFYDADITELYTNPLIKRIEDKEDLGVTGGQWNFDGVYFSCVKGTPESLLSFCRLSNDEYEAVMKVAQSYYDRGCHVVAIACANTAEDCDVTASFSYTFVGLIALEAALLDSVIPAVETCKRVGIKMVMLTEDEKPVAEAIGRMIGLSGKTVTGRMISEAVRNKKQFDLDADIYAQISPVQKLYIIKCLQQKGEIVGMTGTRVTDADALSSADVGITIAESAPAAQENADIIMKNNNIAVISGMISRARQMHCNIKRAFYVMLTGYAAMLVMMSFNLMAGAQPMLNPAVMALLTMFMLPAAALSYLGDRSDKGSKLPPSNYVAKKKLNFWFIGKILISGLLVGGVAIASYMFMYTGSNSDFARSCALVTMSVALAGFSYLNIAESKQLKAMLNMGRHTLLIIAGIAIVPMVLIYIPFVNKCFSMEAVDALALLMSIAAGVLATGCYAVGRLMIKFK